MKIKEQLYTQQEELRNERDSIADSERERVLLKEEVLLNEIAEHSYDYDQDDANYHAQKDLELE